jgi:hypothetical protein
MALYDVYITRTYSSYIVVDAENAKQAEHNAWKLLVNNEINPTEWDCSDTVESGEDLIIMENENA